MYKKSLSPLLSLPFMILTFLVFTPWAGHASEKAPARQDNGRLGIVLYHNGALFDHTVDTTLVRGRNVVEFRRVCPDLIQDSIFIEAGDSVVQSFSYTSPPSTSGQLLAAFEGKEILLATGKEACCTKGNMTKAILLSFHDGKAVVETSSGIMETEVSRIVFPHLPDMYSQTPSVKVVLFSKEEGKSQTDLLYLTRGLRWQANYTGLLSQDEKTISVQAYAAMENRSNIEIRGARLRLVAGNVQFQSGPQPVETRFFQRKAMAAAPAPLPPEPERRELFEYHVYDIPGTTELEPRSRKSIRLFDAGNLPCTKKLVFQSDAYYYYRSADRSRKTLRPDIVLEIDTKTADRGDVPFPSGIFRVYKSDRDGSPTFLGQQRIEAVAAGQKIVLKVGKAFDVTGRKRQLSFKRLKIDQKYLYSYESSYEIAVHNSKDEPVTVFIREEIPGQWSITDENHPHVKEDARHCLWRMEIPASETRVLRYAVKVLE